MAESINSKTLNIPSEVVDSEWKDDIDVDYAIYGDNEEQEGEYISPKHVSRESIKQIKDFQVRLAWNGLNKFRKREQRKLAAA